MKNTYSIKDGVVFIRLLKKGENVGDMLIDENDLERVSKYSWHLSKRGYPSARVNNKLVTVHQYILYGDSKIIDHKDRNRLNNTKGNLRFVTSAMNAHNHGGSNVHLNRGKFVAQIKGNNKTIHLGRFATEEEASASYALAHKYKEHCLLNSIEIDNSKFKTNKWTYLIGSSGEQYIRKYGDRFRVVKNYKVLKLCDTLEEAIKYRDAHILTQGGL